MIIFIKKNLCWNSDKPPSDRQNETVCPFFKLRSLLAIVTLCKQIGKIDLYTVEHKY